MENNEIGISKSVTVSWDLGIHARNAARIASLARRAKGNIIIISKDGTADAKSILDILALACAKDQKITLKIDNSYDIDVLNSIKREIKQGV